MVNQKSSAKGIFWIYAVGLLEGKITEVKIVSSMDGGKYLFVYLQYKNNKQHILFKVMK